MNTSSPLVQELLAPDKHSKKLLQEAYSILQQQDKAYEKLFSKEKHRILNEEAVKKICLKYRLRFLDISFFKNELPNEARQEIKQLERQYGISLKRLRVIAPGELFHLENREKDPILLAELGKGVYLYIHKWGGEFNRFRAAKAWPMKSISNMILSIGLLSLLLTFYIGYVTLNLEMPLDLFLVGWLALWIGCTGFGAIMSISKSIFPTTLIWKSKFLD